MEFTERLALDITKGCISASVNVFFPADEDRSYTELFENVAHNDSIFPKVDQ